MYDGVVYDDGDGVRNVLVIDDIVNQIINDQTGKLVFCEREKFFTVRSARLEQLPPPSPPQMKWGIFKYIFQILRASLAVACMAVFLRAEDLQRALHTFQSGLMRSQLKTG